MVMVVDGGNGNNDDYDCDDHDCGDDVVNRTMMMVGWWYRR